MDYIMSLNLHRRNLTASQKGMIAQDVLPYQEAEAKKRQVRKPESVREFVPEQNSGKASEKAAELMGVNPRYVSDAKKIKEASPEKAAEVRAGRVTIPQTLRGIKAEGAAIKTLDDVTPPRGGALDVEDTASPGPWRRAGTGPVDTDNRRSHGRPRRRSEHPLDGET